MKQKQKELKERNLEKKGVKQLEHL